MYAGMAFPQTEAGASAPAEKNDGEIRKVIVLGGGSAGYLAAISLKVKIPELDVLVIHSKAIPIIGVGEGTTFTIPLFLHGYLGIDPAEFHRLVRPTYKLGIRFLWGPRPRFHYTFTNQLDARLGALPRPNGFYAMEDFDFGDLTGALMAHDRLFERQKDEGPLVNIDAAYHLENRSFVAFLEQFAERVGVRTIDDELTGVDQDERGVTGLWLRSGTRAAADFYLDCSGFRSELIGGAFGEPFESFASSLFCDRAVAGGWKREGETLKPYTTAETMDAGWAWQIEHDDLINRGYVYASNFLSDEAAEAEFRRKNPNVGETRVISFTSGVRRRGWIKNVVGLGNACGFVEPLEATSLAVICEQVGRLVRVLKDSEMRPGEVTRTFYNRFCDRSWRSIRRFLAMHYKFNTRMESPFWRACQHDTDLAGAEDIVAYYRENGPTNLWVSEAIGVGDPFGWEGYLVMMVGQKLPFDLASRPSPEDCLKWSEYRQYLEQRAKKAMDQKEALEIIRSPNWKWRPDFYRNASRW